MRRKQKHYTSEQQIIEKIDWNKAHVVRLNSHAEILEAFSKECAKVSHDLMQVWNEKIGPIAEDANAQANNIRALSFECKEQAIQSRKRARKIEESVLPELGNVLSEFQTIPMIAITGTNHSVASTV